MVVGDFEAFCWVDGEVSAVDNVIGAEERWRGRHRRNMGGSVSSVVSGGGRAATVRGSSDSVRSGRSVKGVLVRIL